MNKKFTTAEFIEKAKAKHGDQYDYSESNYLGTGDPIVIKCPEHGFFAMAAGLHIQKRGNGCKKCGVRDVANQKRVSKEVFLKRAIAKHENKYDYSKVKYINFSTPVEIICPIHKEFFQRPDSHTRHGCNACGTKTSADKKRKTVTEFIEEAKQVHGDKYDYSKITQVGSKIRLVIICKDHGEFYQTTFNHLKGHGCNDCGIEEGANKNRLSSEEFISRAIEVHGYRYDYSEVEYIGNHEDVKIICKDHGKFYQQPANHISNKAGCRKCKNKREGRIAKILERRGIKHKALTIKGKQFDFLLIEYNLIIERDGEQHYMFIEHYSDQDRNYIGKQQENDFNKTQIAKAEGFKVARIPFWLDEKEEEREIDNILSDKPTYPDVPDIKQAITQPKPK